MQERTIFVLFLHTSDSMSWIACPKIDKFSYFYHPSPFYHDIIFKESLFDCNGRGWTGRFSEKTSASRTIATNVESSVAIGGFLGGVSGFRWQTNFTKNSILGVTGVLNSPMEYYNKFGNLCNWWNHQIN